MGVISLILIYVGGFITGVMLLVVVKGKAETNEMKRIEELDAAFSEDSYDFAAITKKLSLLSDRAQATFMFLYIVGISDNKKLLATMSRYLASATRGESTKEVALSRPSKKIKQ